MVLTYWCAWPFVRRWCRGYRSGSLYGRRSCCSANRRSGGRGGGGGGRCSLRFLVGLGRVKPLLHHLSDSIIDRFVRSATEREWNASIRRVVAGGMAGTICSRRKRALHGRLAYLAARSCDLHGHALALHGRRRCIRRRLHWRDMLRRKTSIGSLTRIRLSQRHPKDSKGRAGRSPKAGRHALAEGFGYCRRQLRLPLVRRHVHVLQLRSHLHAAQSSAIVDDND